MSRVWQAAKAERASSMRIVPGMLAEPGWDEGYTQGLVQGRALVEAEYAADRAALAELVAGLAALAPADAMPIEAAMVELAARLAIAIAGEAAIDADLLRARAAAAAALLADEFGTVHLLAHPDDVALLADLDMSVTGDASLQRGSVRAESGPGWATDGVAEAVARVRAAAGL